MINIAESVLKKNATLSPLKNIKVSINTNKKEIEIIKFFLFLYKRKVKAKKTGNSLLK